MKPTGVIMRLIWNNWSKHINLSDTVESFFHIYKPHADWLGKLPHTLEYPQEDEKSPMFHNRDKNNIVPKKNCSYAKIK